MVFNLQDVNDRNTMPIAMVQSALLEMMKDVHVFCVENDIKYSLAYGSLLGAVRHKGFIPWDDDMDIFMTRDNFEKFLKLSSKLKTLEVCSFRNTPNWPYSVSKIINPKTVCVEKINSQRCIVSGLFIDIFLLDDGPKNKYLRKLLKRKIHFYSTLSQGVLAGGSESSLLRNFIGKAISRTYKVNHLNKKIDVMLNKYQGKGSGIMLPVYTIQKLPEYKKEVIESVGLFKFEDTEFYCFDEYDSVLKLLYNNYMQMPKEENRVQHSFLYLDLNCSYKDYIKKRDLKPLLV